MTKQQDSQFRPYVFILREGTRIKEDPLDYSLELLRTQESEALQSPERIKDPTARKVPLMQHLAQQLAGPRASS